MPWSAGVRKLDSQRRGRAGRAGRQLQGRTQRAGSLEADTHRHSSPPGFAARSLCEPQVKAVACPWLHSHCTGQMHVEEEMMLPPLLHPSTLSAQHHSSRITASLEKPSVGKAHLFFLSCVHGKETGEWTAPFTFFINFPFLATQSFRVTNHSLHVYLKGAEAMDLTDLQQWSSTWSLESPQFPCACGNWKARGWITHKACLLLESFYCWLDLHCCGQYCNINCIPHKISHKDLLEGSRRRCR